MESRLEESWRRLGGFWQNEEMMLGLDDGEDVQGSMDEIFAVIAQSGSEEAK